MKTADCFCSVTWWFNLHLRNWSWYYLTETSMLTDGWYTNVYFIACTQNYSLAIVMSWTGFKCEQWRTFPSQVYSVFDSLFTRGLKMLTISWTAYCQRRQWERLSYKITCPVQDLDPAPVCHICDRIKHNKLNYIITICLYPVMLLMVLFFVCSVGIENADDLIRDLSQALDKVALWSNVLESQSSSWRTTTVT